MSPPKSAPWPCWVLSDGRRGIENQALGLAEACHILRPLDITPHVLKSRAAFQASSPRLQLALRSKPWDYGLNGIPAPLVIGCGRQAIAPLIALKKTYGSQVFTVYIQDPRMEAEAFDLVIAPEHDGLSGPNVENMIGSPNRVTKAEIAGQTLQFEEKLLKLPMPRAALLIGGQSKTHKLGRAQHIHHVNVARDLVSAGYSVLITTSRRTPDFALQDYKTLADEVDNIWLYDGEGQNPYYAFLGGADILCVTEDSTNMLTEACTTGKPVFTLPMQGKSGKFQQLYDSLSARCHMRPFDGNLTAPAYAPLDETVRIATQLWAHFDARDAVFN